MQLGYYRYTQHTMVAKKHQPGKRERSAALLEIYYFQSLRSRGRGDKEPPLQFLPSVVYQLLAYAVIYCTFYAFVL